MTVPRLILSGQGGAYDLNDGVYHELGYQGVDGLFEPSVVAKGATVETFDGPVRVRPQATRYDARTFSLLGYAIGGNGLAETDGRIHGLFEAVQGPNSRVHVGSLFLDTSIVARPRSDRFRDFTRRRDYRLECEAIPGLWGCAYGYAVGVSQGIPVSDDRLDHTSLKVTAVDSTGRVFSIANPGSAPCAVALMLTVSSGDMAADKTVYVRNVDARTTRRVAVIVDHISAGVGIAFVPAAAGLILMPGTNILRIENAAGTLETQTDSGGTPVWVHAISASAMTFRSLGNDADKFNEQAPFALYRRGVATAVTDEETVSDAGNMAPRVGLPNGLTAYAASKIGVVLEQNTVNIVDNGDCEAAIPTINATSGQVRVTAATSLNVAVNGSRSLLVTTSATSGSTDNYYVVGANAGGASLNNMSPGTTYSVHTWAYTPAAGGATPGNVFLLFYYKTSGGSYVSTYSNVATIVEGWNFLYLTVTIPAGATEAFLRLMTNQAADGLDVYWDNIQIEASPFPTSFTAKNRNADQAALFRPHNYLKYSRDLTQTSAWSVSGTGAAQPTRSGTAADGTASSNLWVIANVDNKVYQSVTPDCRPNATPWMVMVALRLPAASALSGLMTLQIEDQDGNVQGGAQQINTSDLSTTETRTFYLGIVGASMGSTDTGLRAVLRGTTNTGNVIIEQMALIKGSFPGPMTHTEGAAVPLPKYGYDWPTWITQNGYIQFSAVLPPISTGLTYYVLGESTNKYAAIWRDTADTTGENFLHIARRNNVSAAASTTNDINVGAVWDGAVHVYKLWWRNYTVSGTQTMVFGLDVDAVTKSTSANVASATVTSWATPERLVLSLGEVMATLRDISYGAYSVPAGAIPADIA